LIDLENNDNCRAVVCIRQVSNGGVNPTASSLPQVTNFDIEYYDAETLYFECNAAGFNFYPDNWYAFGIRIISLYGVPSPWIQFTVQAI
jgi:hypothetical protein